MGGFSYPDHFIFDAEPMPEAYGAGVAGIFLIVYLLFFLFIMALSIATYVLHSLGLHTIAKRRGIRNGWLAWIPMGNLWILGNISDQYQYVVKGRVKNRRKLLLGLGIGFVAVYVGWIMAIMMSLILSEGIASGAEMAILLAFFGAIVMVVLSITLVINQYLCLYDLYRSCDPGNATVFLVLSIFFSITMPFFVFFCRNKDLGMPPRRQPAPQQVVIPTVEVVADPNVVEKVVVPTVEPVTEEGFAQPEEFEE